MFKLLLLLALFNCGDKPGSNSGSGPVGSRGSELSSGAGREPVVSGDVSHETESEKSIGPAPIKVLQVSETEIEIETSLQGKLVLVFNGEASRNEHVIDLEQHSQDTNKHLIISIPTIFMSDNYRDKSIDATGFDGKKQFDPIRIWSYGPELNEQLEGYTYCKKVPYSGYPLFKYPVLTKQIGNNLHIYSAHRLTFLNFKGHNCHLPEMSNQVLDGAFYEYSYDMIDKFLFLGLPGSKGSINGLVEIFFLDKPFVSASALDIADVWETPIPTTGSLELNRSPEHSAIWIVSSDFYGTFSFIIQYNNGEIHEIKSSNIEPNRNSFFTMQLPPGSTDWNKPFDCLVLGKNSNGDILDKHIIFSTKDIGKPSYKIIKGNQGDEMIVKCFEKETELVGFSVKVKLEVNKDKEYISWAHTKEQREGVFFGGHYFKLKNGDKIKITNSINDVEISTTESIVKLEE